MSDERTAEQAEQEVQRQMADAIRKDPSLLGEVLSSPLPDSFWKMCEKRETAEQLVKSAYAAGIVAALQDPIGVLENLSKYLGVTIVVREAPEPVDPSKQN